MIDEKQIDTSYIVVHAYIQLLKDKDLIKPDVDTSTHFISSISNYVIEVAFRDDHNENEYIYLHVPKNWLESVHKIGLTTAGGMLTLSAEFMDCSHGVMRYSATWIDQDSSYNVRIEHGYIVTNGPRFHHEHSILESEKTAMALGADRYTRRNG